jgi:hypothetical protein
METSFASQSHARVINTRMALATTKKGSSTIAEYFSKMKSLADDMSSAGKKLDDEELCSYILVGLNAEYNSLVSSIAARIEPITISELYSQSLAYETWVELQNQGTSHSQSFANNASCGHGTYFRGRCGRNSNSRGGRGRGEFNNRSKNRFPPCQLCGRTNHPVFKCYKRFGPTYMGEEKSPNTTNSYGIDSNWYADSGATDHVTRELENLTVKDTYHGNDQIYTASGSGMHIQHIGKSIICTSYRDLELNHVLHVPQSSKTLAFVHRVATDNNVFFELHPDFFFLLRIGSQEKLYFKEGLKEAFILYHAAPPHPLANKFSIAARF